MFVRIRVPSLLDDELPWFTRIKLLGDLSIPSGDEPANALHLHLPGGGGGVGGRTQYPAIMAPVTFPWPCSAAFPYPSAGWKTYGNCA